MTINQNYLSKSKISIRNQSHPNGYFSTSIFINESLIWRSRRYKMEDSGWRYVSWSEENHKLFFVSNPKCEYSFRNIHFTSHE